MKIKMKKINSLYYNIRLILCILYLILIFGCNNNNGIKEIPSKVVINSVSLGFIREMVVSNSFLILLDKKPLNNDNQLKVYDLKSLKYLYSMGRIGKGPGEFTQGMSLNKVNYDSSGFSLLDLSSYKMLIYQPDNYDTLRYFKAIKLTDGRPYMPVIVNDTTIFSLGLALLSGRFAEYNETGKMIKTLGNLPHGRRKNTPVPSYEQACKGLIRMTPNGKRVIVSYQFANVIDIYDKKGDLLKRIVGEKNKSPQYKVLYRNGYPTMQIDREKAAWGYLDIQVTNNNIIALFSGKPVANAGYQSNKIYVYNLNGNLKKEYRLDRKVSQIALDINNNRLLAINIISKPEVYSFNLRDIMN